MAKKSMEKDRYLYLYLTTALICILIVAVIAAILLTGNLFSEEESGIVVSESSMPFSEPVDQNSVESIAESEDEPEELFVYREIAFQNDAMSEGSLILVKNTTDATAPEKEALELVNIYNNRPKGLYKLSGSGLVLEKEAFEAFNEMTEAFLTATQVSDIMINDAFVAIKDLKNRDIFYDYADLASGRTVRLTVFPSDKGKMGEGVYLWLEDHCSKYGYILRYPSDKTEQTGAASSVSVYRYVGVPHSKYMTENSITLEEYLEEIKSRDYTDPLVYTDADSKDTYYIYYQQAGTGTSTNIKVPSELEYTFSGNNTDGFIITVSVGEQQ